MDEMEFLRELSKMLDEYSKDEERLKLFLTGIMTELEGHVPLRDVLDALEGVLEVKYVWDELDKQYFATLLKRLLSKKRR